MHEHTSKKVTLEVTPEQKELLELVDPREVPGIYRGLEYMWQRAVFVSPEDLNEEGQLAAYRQWKVMETIGRINPEFNPLQD